MSEVIKVYKGTDENMECRGYRFTVGEKHTKEKAELCKSGFHGCEYPLDVFSYYSPNSSRYFEAELEDVDEKHDEDKKRVGCTIRLTGEIELKTMAAAAVDYIVARIKHEHDAESNTGNQSAATNTGNQSAATVKGKHSVAIVTGSGSCARGAKGCVLVLIERNQNGEITAHRSIQVDGEQYKEMTYYTLRDGKVVEEDTRS